MAGILTGYKGVRLPKLTADMRDDAAEIARAAPLTLAKSRLAGLREADKIDLLYCDESGFSCAPNVQRAWSRLGTTHVADASVGHKRVNVIGALNYTTGKLDVELFKHSIKRQH